MGGRLTLSWVNKDEALMPDANGDYEWVERSDPRVNEVRLLHAAGQIGEAADGADNGSTPPPRTGRARSSGATAPTAPHDLDRGGNQQLTVGAA